MIDLSIFERQPDNSFKIRFPRNSTTLKNAEVYYQTMLMMVGNIAAQLRNNKIKGDSAIPMIGAAISSISDYIVKLQQEDGLVGGIEKVTLKNVSIDSARNINIQINVDGDIYKTNS